MKLSTLAARAAMANQRIVVACHSLANFLPGNLAGEVDRITAACHRDPAVANVLQREAIAGFLEAACGACMALAHARQESIEAEASVEAGASPAPKPPRPRKGAAAKE